MGPRVRSPPRRPGASATNITLGVRLPFPTAAARSASSVEAPAARSTPEISAAVSRPKVTSIKRERIVAIKRPGCADVMMSSTSAGGSSKNFNSALEASWVAKSTSPSRTTR